MLREFFDCVRQTGNAVVRNDPADQLAANSADEFARLDYAFHLSIVEATQNRFMVDAYRGLSNTFAGYVNLILALGPLASMLNFHDGLVDAIERRDPAAAQREVEENFMETDVWLRLLTPNGKNAGRKGKRGPD